MALATLRAGMTLPKLVGMCLMFDQATARNASRSLFDLLNIVTVTLQVNPVYINNRPWRYVQAAAFQM